MTNSSDSKNNANDDIDGENNGRTTKIAIGSAIIGLIILALLSYVIFKFYQRIKHNNKKINIPMHREIHSLLDIENMQRIKNKTLERKANHRKVYKSSSCHESSTYNIEMAMKHNIDKSVFHNKMCTIKKNEFFV
ncbi:hypothetical protein A3Q56_02445 [Intoshia linei]|uniref:Uncharacterized protein n=1 Tax=Intoshia linei TaxID=1819745 RepID=A0A177B6B0_9BILA|nr:hypothetical protein A3Q56_02445 [Intoshia linei]